MYTSFEARNFRCFRELNIPSLERMNLVAGVNNIGKTALLEALFLHCGAYSPGLTLKLSAFRGVEQMKVELGPGVETPWDSLFHQFDISKTIELAGENTVSGRRSVRLRLVRQPSELAGVLAGVKYGAEESGPILSTLERVKVLELQYEERDGRGSSYLILGPEGISTQPIPPPPPFPAFFQGARMRVPSAFDAERYGKLEIQGQQDLLLRVLQLIEPRLRRLAMVVAGGQAMLHGDIGIDRLVPLPVMGEGMVRLASLVLLIGVAPGGVVLVDEIENGLHHSILATVWRAIGDVARQFETQVFATTHSLECIEAAHKAFAESDVYDFLLHRLERSDETIRAVTYDQEALEAAIETGLEVR